MKVLSASRCMCVLNYFVFFFFSFSEVRRFLLVRMRSHRNYSLVYLIHSSFFLSRQNRRTTRDTILYSLRSTIGFSWRPSCTKKNNKQPVRFFCLSLAVVAITLTTQKGMKQLLTVILNDCNDLWIEGLEYNYSIWFIQFLWKWEVRRNKNVESFVLWPHTTVFPGSRKWHFIFWNAAK